LSCRAVGPSHPNKETRFQIQWYIHKVESVSILSNRFFRPWRRQRAHQKPLKMPGCRLSSQENFRVHESSGFRTRICTAHYLEDAARWNESIPLHPFEESGSEAPVGM